MWKEGRGGFKWLLEMRAISISWGWGERPKSLDDPGGKLIVRKRDPKDSEYMNTGPKGWAR